jgi:hypothetical protein
VEGVQRAQKIETRHLQIGLVRAKGKWPQSMKRQRKGESFEIEVTREDMLTIVQICVEIM